MYLYIGCTLHAFRQNRTDVAVLQHILSYWFAAQEPVLTGINTSSRRWKYLWHPPEQMDETSLHQTSFLINFCKNCDLYKPHLKIIFVRVHTHIHMSYIHILWYTNIVHFPAGDSLVFPGVLSYSPLIRLPYPHGWFLFSVAWDAILGWWLASSDGGTTQYSTWSLVFVGTPTFNKENVWHSSKLT